jgi:transcriptional regulator with XRE-family HTH domain
MKKKNNVGGYERLKIGTNIRKWRGIKDMKQKDLASALRMSEAAISNIENDLTDVTLSQLEDIAVTLDVEVEKLFTDPQEAIENVNYNATSENKNQLVMDSALVYALIGSIQKKDDQLKDVLDSVMFTMDKFVKTEKPVQRMSKLH